MPSIGQNLHPYTGKGEVSMLVKNFRVGQNKTEHLGSFRFLEMGPHFWFHLKDCPILFPLSTRARGTKNIF